MSDGFFSNNSEYSPYSGRENGAHSGQQPPLDSHPRSHPYREQQRFTEQDITYHFPPSPDLTPSQHTQELVGLGLGARRDGTGTPLNERRVDQMFFGGDNGRGFIPQGTPADGGLATPTPARPQVSQVRPQEPVRLTLCTPSRNSASSSASSPASRPVAWEEFVDGVGNKHGLAGESLKLLYGFSKVAQHPNPIAADIGTRIDLYGLGLKQLEILKRIEKQTSDVPVMKQKVDGLDEKINKAKFAIEKAAKDGLRTRIQAATYQWDCLDFDGPTVQLIDELKRNIELQKKYGLDAGMKVESHRRDIEDGIKRIGSSVRDNLRREVSDLDHCCQPVLTAGEVLGKPPTRNG
ncbi:hypothetical protein VNI00_016011 [Paramarasmius palmivorus]|uniref:Uncharacterized protein n=1 Tax=Paramarasmius palmivorus TaxID=297713 RepID=A0AAW0BHD4_9AGAR